MSIESMNNLLAYYPIIFTSGVEHDGYMWFVTANFNGLFKMCCRNGEIEYLGKLPTKGDMYLCSNVIYYSEKLFLISNDIKGIIEYDIQLKKFDVYKIPCECEEIGFYGAGQYQNYLFFWSYVNYYIIRFDMEITQFKIISVLTEKMRLEEIPRIHEFGTLWRGFCTLENHLYIPSPEKDIILDVNMEKSTVDVHVIQGMEGYLTICYDGEKFWLTGLDNRIVIWRPDIKNVKVCDIDLSIQIKDVRLCVYNESSIYYSLCNSEDILRLSTDNMKFNLIESNFKGICSRYSKMYSFKTILLQNIGGVIYTLNCADCILQTIEKDKKRIYKKDLIYGVEEFIRDRLKHYFGEEAGAECDTGRGLGIKEFIKYITEFNIESSEFTMRNVSIGQRIKNEIDEWMIK